MMEYKSAPLEIKATGDEGIVEGYYSVFDNVDDGGDITHQGAFTKTIKERGHRVQVFFAHLWDRPIAPPPEVLFEDAKGLFAKYGIILGSFWGREAWELIKGGGMREGSFGFEIIKADWERDKTPGAGSGARHLRELKLFELSPVPLGMNPLTAIRAIKAGALPTEDHLEVITAILEEIKAGRMLVTADTDALRTVHDSFTALADAINDKLAAAEPVIDHSPLLRARYRMADHAMYRLAH